jgi:pyridoxal phosphate enzyme (YggS family)
VVSASAGTVDIAANLAAVRNRLADAATRAGRQPESVTLVAVSKTHPAEAVIEAARAGATVFGENRVQEAAAKIPLLRREGLSWHLIGHLQTNKINAALGLFDQIESVDSLRLAQAIDSRVQSANRTPLPVLLEVYVGDDPDRPGFRPEQLLTESQQLTKIPGIEIQGLMTVAPLGWAQDAASRAFRTVRELRDQLARQYPLIHFAHLSMGMTEDFERAIEEGSTMVRVGRAIFGART